MRGLRRAIDPGGDKIACGATMIVCAAPRRVPNPWVLLAIGIAAAVCACQAPSGQRRSDVLATPAIVGSDACGQPHQAFMSMAAAFTQKSLASAEQSSPTRDVSSLVTDAQAEDDSLAGVVETFGTLAACRGDALADDEIKTARGALEIAGVSQKRLAARLASQENGAAPAVSDRNMMLVVSSPVERPYLATETGRIYDRPSSKARPSASLRKGQRVIASAPASADTQKSGWLQIELNDGSTGYVSSEVVRPLEKHMPKGIADKANTTVAVIDLITEALPEKLAALEARLAASETIPNGGT